MTFHKTAFSKPRDVKRAHKWIVDSSEPQLLSSKRNTPTAGMGNLNAESKGFENQLQIRSLVNLLVSQANQDPSLCYGGIRRVKVKQVGASDNGEHVSIGHPYGRGDNNLSVDAACDITENMSLGPTYDKGKGTSISMGPTFTNPSDNFVSMGHTFSKRDSSLMLMGHNLFKGYDNSLSIRQPFDKGDGAFVSMGHVYEKGNSSAMSASPGNKEHENFVSMVSTYNKDNGDFISVGPFCGKGDVNGKAMRPTSVMVAASTYVKSRGTTNEKGNSGNMSMEENCLKETTGSNSFGDLQNEWETFSVGMTSGYAAGNKIVAPAAKSKTKATLKIKEPNPRKKIVLNNNFPTNVKCLLSTGILDGVPVKYVSWCREPELRAIVKGMGYLCGCVDCKYSKCLSAYELERHAGCKTKHPNNHIYFENGKTIYAVVQELKNTPKEILFETIENVTKSPINQKNFCAWKASYLVANRELQRIYGKDKLTMAA